MSDRPLTEHEIRHIMVQVKREADGMFHDFENTLRGSTLEEWLDGSPIKLTIHLEMPTVLLSAND